MDIFITLTIVFGSITLITTWLLWICRSVIIEIFGKIKHWFLRHKGYGYVFIYEPNKRLIRHYTKLNEAQIKINKNTYANKPDQQFDFNGIRSILFNLNDAEPVDIYKDDESNKMERNSKFWDNFASLIKLYYQTKTSEALIITLLFLILLGVAASVALNGYAVYILTEGATKVVPI